MRKVRGNDGGISAGGPLSPLCANIILNELDHELERRGHRFVRYADDMVIFYKSKASAADAGTHHTVHRGKTLPESEQGEDGRGVCGKDKVSRIRVLQGKERFRHEGARQIRRQDAGEGKGAHRPRKRLRTKEEWTKAQRLFVQGWVNYFKLADMAILTERTDEWMRRRIRMVFLKRWKRYRTKYRNLKNLGLSEDDAKKIASSRKGVWHIAKCYEFSRALPNDRLQRAGFEYFSTYYRSVHVA